MENPFDVFIDTVAEHMLDLWHDIELVNDNTLF